MTQLHPEHSPNFSGAHGVVMQHESSKLLPWLMLIALLAGISVGLSLQTSILQNQSENRTRAELDKQNRFLQELRIRVEDAEIAAEEVNPKFHPRRTE